MLEVFRAIPKVLEKHSNVRFVFGGGWHEQEVRDEMEGGVAEHPDWPVTIIEKIYGEDKFNALRDSDVFVFPTYYPPEGHPWAIIEAMAAGMPVISTDQGAITESVVDGVTGYIVEKRNADAVAEKICAMLEDPDRRRQMGRDSRKLYEEKLTEAQLVENFSDVFNAVLEKR